MDIIAIFMVVGPITTGITAFKILMEFDSAAIILVVITTVAMQELLVLMEEENAANFNFISKPVNITIRYSF